MVLTDRVLRFILQLGWICIALGIGLRLIFLPGSVPLIIGGAVSILAAFLMLARVVNGPLLGLPKLYLAFLLLGLVSAQIGLLYRLNFWPGGALAGVGLLGLPAWFLWQRLPTSESARQHYSWMRWPTLIVLALNLLTLALSPEMLYRTIHPKRALITFQQRKEGWDVSSTGRLLAPGDSTNHYSARQQSR